MQGQVFCPNEVNTSIGIIGGADGPTSIFVTSHFSFPNTAIFALFFLAGGVTKQKGEKTHSLAVL
jgi:hypothetical protein